MRADQDVDAAEPQPLEDVGALAATLAAGQDRDLDAGGGRQRRDGAVVLPRQDFGGRHQRRLPSAFDDGRGGQERHHGLARADVALQQPQHPLGLGQIGGDVGDRARLRRRERIGQCIDELLAQRAGARRRAAGGAAQVRAHQRQRELPGKQFVIGKPHPGAALRQDIRRAPPADAVSSARRQSPDSVRAPPRSGPAIPADPASFGNAASTALRT